MLAEPIVAWFLHEYYTAMVTDPDALNSWYAPDAAVLVILNGAVTASDGNAHLKNVKRFFEKATVEVSQVLSKGSGSLETLFVSATGTSTNAKGRTTFKHEVTLVSLCDDTFYIAQEVWTLRTAVSGKRGEVGANQSGEVVGRPYDKKPRGRGNDEGRQNNASVESKVLFNVGEDATEDDIRTALGSLCEFLVDLRYLPHKKLVFCDFNIDDALTRLKQAQLVIAGHPIHPIVQNERRRNPQQREGGHGAEQRQGPRGGGAAVKASA